MWEPGSQWGEEGRKTRDGPISPEGWWPMGLDFCQYGESREAEQPSSLVLTEGVCLGTQKNKLQDKFKGEVKRNLERDMGL